MTKIPAHIVSSTEGELSLEVHRTGGCHGCAQQKSCAISWQLDDSPTYLNVQSPITNYRVGEQVLLNCDDKTLLKYTSILFLPTLIFLLGATLVTNSLLPDTKFIEGIVCQFLMPILIGFWISHKWLGVFNKDNSLSLSRLETELYNDIE